MAAVSRAFPFALFLLLWIHGATLGPTDDEAYYWVLAQRPDWGYAFHPPMVAWSLWPFHSLASTVWLRLPSAAFAAGILALGLSWLRSAGVTKEQALARGAWVLVSFAGLFGSAWMMVPDLPLLFAWMAIFVLTWRLCFAGSRVRWGHFAGLGAATAMAILSKYSGVIAAGCSALALLLWARPRERWRGVAALLVGGLVAAVPILVWNSQHEWQSLLYQFRDRHSGGGGFSAVRWGRFWAAELILAGPPLLAFTFVLLREWRERLVTKYLALWILPHLLVFALQPAWADFKPHWAFVIWLPAALGLAWRYANGKRVGWARAQMAYGLGLFALAALACQVPMLSFFVSEPKLDVTNDLYGWEKLREFLGGRERLPVVGSRYQTASQAAFALGEPARVTLIPRDLKQRDEWPELGVSEGSGPAWPRLVKSVYFVSDYRYTAGPEFRGARCASLSRLETRRFGRVARWIEVWRCDPASG